MKFRNITAWTVLLAGLGWAILGSNSAYAGEVENPSIEARNDTGAPQNTKASSNAANHERALTIDDVRTGKTPTATPRANANRNDESNAGRTERTESKSAARTSISAETLITGAPSKTEGTPVEETEEDTADDDRNAALETGLMKFLSDDESSNLSGSNSVEDGTDTALDNLDSEGSGEQPVFDVYGAGRDGADDSETGHDIGTVETPKSNVRDEHVELGEHGEIERIHAAARSRKSEVRTCYADAVAEDSSLQGKVVVKFMLEPNGDVLAPVVDESTLGNEDVATCVVETMTGWNLTKPESGKRTLVKHPYFFYPRNR